MIVFDPGVFSVPRTITIVLPPPQINGVLTITGPSASLLTATRTGGGVPGTRKIPISL